MKFINSYADPASGESSVYIKHRGKVFQGNAHCNKEDTFSKIEGCVYAEERAKINALKYDLKLKKQEYIDYKKFISGLSNYKKFDKESDTAKAVYRHLNRKKREIEILEQIIANRISILNETITNSSDIKERIKQKCLKDNTQK